MEIEALVSGKSRRTGICKALTFAAGMVRGREAQKKKGLSRGWAAPEVCTVRTDTRVPFGAKTVLGVGVRLHRDSPWANQKTVYRAVIAVLGFVYGVTE